MVIAAATALGQRLREAAGGNGCGSAGERRGAEEGARGAREGAEGAGRGHGGLDGSWGEWRGSWKADWGRCGRTAVEGELGVAVAVVWSCDELR